MLQILVSFYFVLFLSTVEFSTGREMSQRLTVSRMLDKMFPNYDKTLRPQFGGPAVEVGVTSNVDSLGPIDEVNMNFRIDLSFRQYWRDERLKFTAVEGQPVYNKPLTLSHDFLKRIWVPDTYFPDSLSASKQEVMVPNVLIRLSPDGSILYR
ncbi:gamma-aminobutyric acid receptor subunit beta-3-like [Symsagittifera roscoffensis]|uniref:gamma-aminobutyric acid receptor subunit beta-3-like n=1 Tax=Symsagittifera roscoffensis TaxID=84072 RepID=UPI00307B54E0